MSLGLSIHSGLPRCRPHLGAGLWDPGTLGQAQPAAATPQGWDPARLTPKNRSKLGQRPERRCSPRAVGLWLPHRPGGGSGGGGSQEIGSQHTPVLISGRLKM